MSPRRDSPSTSDQFTAEDEYVLYRPSADQMREATIEVAAAARDLEDFELIMKVLALPQTYAALAPISLLLHAQKRELV